MKGTERSISFRLKARHRPDRLSGKPTVRDNKVLVAVERVNYNVALFLFDSVSAAAAAYIVLRFSS